LFGPDDIPVRGQLQVEGDEIVGMRHSETAVGLATLWEVGRVGKMFLQTTRLPSRERPYILNVELARARLLRISQKREEWGAADLSLPEEHRELIDEALDRFIAALCQLDEPAAAGRLADEALTLALQGGEALALAHGRAHLERRNSAQGFARHSFGCCLDPKRMGDPKYLKHVKEQFHFVTVPMTWRDLEPEEQKRDFGVLDECVRWLNHQRIAAKVGPLLTFSPPGVPDWLYIWEHDFEQVREMAYEFVRAVVERYGPKVQAWDVISGMNAENCFKFSFDQLLEMTRSAALAAKRASPRSLVLIELTEPWGEYYATNQRTVPPLIYADMIGQSGVPFDGYGIRVRFGWGGEGMRTRDLLELASLLDRFAVLGRPVHLSGVQAPSAADSRDNSGKGGEAGYWHGPWSEAVQADWLEQVYQVALSRSYVETVTWQDLADRGAGGVMRHGGLLREDLTAKPAFARLVGLKNALVRAERKSGRGAQGE